MNSNQPTRRPAAGFSLVEVLVVIAIMLILLTLGIVVAGKLKTGAEEDSARAQLQQIMAVVGEYRGKVGQSPNHYGSIPISTGTDCNGIEKLMDGVAQYKATGNMMETQRKNFPNPDADLADVTEIRDPWGTALKYVASNVSGDTCYDNKLPEHASPFVASAGPDGVWNTSDDIYSFDLGE